MGSLVEGLNQLSAALSARPSVAGSLQWAVAVDSGMDRRLRSRDPRDGQARSFSLPVAQQYGLVLSNSLSVCIFWHMWLSNLLASNCFNFD